MLFLCLATIVIALTVTRAEEKLFSVGNTVTTLYDFWDSISSSLQRLLDCSYKDRVCLKNNADTLADGPKGFKVDFGQSEILELFHIQTSFLLHYLSAFYDEILSALLIGDFRALVSDFIFTGN